MDRVLSCTKDDCYLSSPAVDGPGKLNREASRLELECNAVLRVKSELERERAGEEAKRLRLRDVRRQLETLAEPLEVPLHLSRSNGLYRRLCPVSLYRLMRQTSRR